MDYLQRLTPVIRYLEQHYEESVNLQLVAEMANLSPYHFHRIFKAVTGETLASYIKRLKLQNAAQQLFFKKVSVMEVALDHGFSSSQSLAKAFRLYFGLTPTEIRNCTTLEEYSVLLRNSKIGHTLRKPRHESFHSEDYSVGYQPQRSENMKTELFEERWLAYVRVTGPYGENYEPALGKLYQWAGAKGLQDGQCVFIYHDNPEATPADKCRTDICLTVPEDTEGSQGIEVKKVPAGSYASIRETVTEQSQYGTFWESLMEQIVASGLEVDDRPCFELYHSYNPETRVADVSFCEPIKA
ncbi:AraC family transcriptional regulator [Photobacterium alginatilyticum]|uniref:AraC family transcriptional regulator n=1 Tax=Photobacterium alginatilyticum TaxID=1775171 RepID=A0ABW9YF42_9GAMM|nr:AraC family transcriptional regulator [Photobacterium alginatilyticum]NBI52045.1 AraC family transcriptional regulator [Photobacterium alginatilyticum]